MGRNNKIFKIGDRVTVISSCDAGFDRYGNIGYYYESGDRGGLKLKIVKHYGYNENRKVHVFIAEDKRGRCYYFLESEFHEYKNRTNPKKIEKRKVKEAKIKRKLFRKEALKRLKRIRKTLKEKRKKFKEYLKEPLVMAGSLFEQREIILNFDN